MLRDLVVALSLSNLWFLSIWRLFLIRHPTFYPYYHWKSNPSTILLAAMLDVVLLAALFWLGIMLARRSSKPIVLRLARAIFLLVFFLALSNVLAFVILSPTVREFINSLMQPVLKLFPSIGGHTVYNALWLMAGLVSLLVITILVHRLIFRPRQLIRMSVGILLILSPFVLVTFSQAAWQWAKFRDGEQFRDVNAPPLANARNSSRRVLWLIFDELDFRLTFEGRPSSLKLPEFDRLRSEAMFATNAFPPAGDTVLSLPALTTGKLVSESIRSAPNELMLTFGGDTQRVSWSGQPTIFSQARSLGVNTGLAGSYHPYCRILGNSLTKCFWETIPFFPDQDISRLASASEPVSLPKSMKSLWQKASLPAAISPFVLRMDGTVWRKDFFDGFANIHRESLAMASDPRLGLIIVHYPIPHPPGVYDRSINDFAFDAQRGYLDNLALADRVLGQLRKTMEEAGVWDSTTLLVSSDHRLRIDRVWRDHPILKPYFTREDPAVLNSVRDERIPFILKFAGESNSVTYEAAFNTVLSHDLLLAFLTRQVSNSEEAARWIDDHRSIGQSPYTEGDK